MGLLSGYKAKVEVTPDFWPFILRLYPVSSSLIKAMNSEVRKLMLHNIVE